VIVTHSYARIRPTRDHAAQPRSILPSSPEHQSKFRYNAQGRGIRIECNRRHARGAKRFKPISKQRTRSFGRKPLPPRGRHQSIANLEIADFCRLSITWRLEMKPTNKLAAYFGDPKSKRGRRSIDRAHASDDCFTLREVRSFWLINESSHTLFSIERAEVLGVLLRNWPKDEPRRGQRRLHRTGTKRIARTFTTASPALESARSTAVCDPKGRDVRPTSMVR